MPSKQQSAPASAAPARLKDRYDAVIIGGGHNGLVCACYLAGAGLSVAVFERRDIVGGAAVTEEFHPGFRNSTASYTVSLLHPKVIHELCLKEHGLQIVGRPMSNFLPLPGGEYLKVGGASVDGCTISVWPSTDVPWRACTACRASCWELISPYPRTKADPL